MQIFVDFVTFIKKGNFFLWSAVSCKQECHRKPLSETSSFRFVTLICRISVLYEHVCFIKYVIKWPMSISIHVMRESEHFLIKLLVIKKMLIWCKRLETHYHSKMLKKHFWIFSFLFCLLKYQQGLHLWFNCERFSVFWVFRKFLLLENYLPYVYFTLKTCSLSHGISKRVIIRQYNWCANQWTLHIDVEVYMYNICYKLQRHLTSVSHDVNKHYTDLWFFFTWLKDFVLTTESTTTSFHCTRCRLNNKNNICYLC